MIIVFLRSLILYIILLFVIRMMGKRQIGDMQPFELVITLIIANLAVISMENIQKPLFFGIIAILTLLVIHHLVVFIVKHFLRARYILEGAPSILITPTGVNFSELNKNRLNISDLIECIRGAGYFTLDSIAYGIYETNGTFSVIESNEYKKSNLYPPTSPPSIPLVLVEHGKVNKHTQKTACINKEWILEQVKCLKIDKIKKIAIMTVDNYGKIYIQKKCEHYQVLQATLEGAKLW